MKYSFKKGLKKGILSAAIIAGAFVVFAGFADFTIWQLLEQYVKPILGTITIGALFKMLINYLKIKFVSQE